MKIAITGGLGQLGRSLSRVLVNHDLLIIDLPELDITNGSSVMDCLTEWQPDLVIHCAAYTDVDGCARNPELAYQVNALGTQNVALACRTAGAAMVHISTNEVFAGDDPGGYQEWRPLGPINAYGRSKAAAEYFVHQIMGQFFIVRTAWLYAPGGRNFIHAIIERAREGKALKVVVDEIGNPTNVVDLAQAIHDLITSELYGVYHFTNSGSCSRWAFAREILRLSDLDLVPVIPILSRNYKRASTPPPYGDLINEAGAANGITLRPWTEAVAEYIQEYGS
jgi:dTDP-4-dehydrorhamnose reductase